MMLRALLILPLVLLMACTPAQQDDIARDAAKTAIRPVLEERFPGIPLEPATDCIIDNATSREIFSLAGDAVTGPTANTVEIVTRIASRPGTIECLAKEGLPVLLGRL